MKSYRLMIIRMIFPSRVINNRENIRIKYLVLKQMSGNVWSRSSIECLNDRIVRHMRMSIHRRRLRKKKHRQMRTKNLLHNPRPSSLRLSTLIHRLPKKRNQLPHQHLWPMNSYHWNVNNNWHSLCSFQVKDKKCCEVKILFRLSLIDRLFFSHFRKLVFVRGIITTTFECGRHKRKWSFLSFPLQLFVFSSRWNYLNLEENKFTMNCRSPVNQSII